MPERFPAKGQYLECNHYKDRNDCAWRVAVVESGFFVGYSGHDYFKPKIFDLNVNGGCVVICNTGCFFIQDTRFDTFYQIRTILKSGYTDDIWDVLECFLSERLSIDSGLMGCEILNGRG